MLLSSTLLNKAVKKYNLLKTQKEKFSSAEVISEGVNASFVTFYMFIAIIFFLLELLVLFYSITIAVYCTQAGPERIMHITLAILFTIPYALLNIFFNDCAKKTLKSSTGFFPSMKTTPLSSFGNRCSSL
jgi:hypothetical protein